MALGALVLLPLGTACRGVPPCSEELQAGDAVEITLVERWREGPYEWDAVNLWGQEGPACEGVDALATGATIRLEVAEIAVAWVTDNRGNDCRPALGVVTSDVGVSLRSQPSGLPPGNALLGSGYIDCDTLSCSGGWGLGVFVADAHSVFAPLVAGQSARVAVLRVVQHDGVTTCSDVWAAEVHRVE